MVRSNQKVFNDDILKEIKEKGSTIEEIINSRPDLNKSTVRYRIYRMLKQGVLEKEKSYKDLFVNIKKLQYIIKIKK